MMELVQFLSGSHRNRRFFAVLVGFEPSLLGLGHMCTGAAPRGIVPLEVSTMRQCLRGCAAVLAVVVLLGQGILADGPCVFTVQAGDSIQEAIDMATAGAVICLAEGTWQENLVIGKSLTLRGAGADLTTIEGTVSGASVLSISSRTEIVVTVEALTVTGAHGSWAYGIKLDGRPRCTLREVAVHANASNGIYVMDATHVLIVGSSVTGNRGMGIRVQQDAQAEVRDTTVAGNSGDGLSLTDSAQVTLVDAVIRGNGGDGVAVLDTIDVAILGSIIEANVRDGLSVRQSFGSTTETHVKVTGTTLSGNTGYGLALYGSAQVTVTDCTVADHGRDGLLLSQTVVVLIGGSRILGNASRGIIIQGSAQATIENTSVRENTWQGILMSDSAQATIDGAIVSGNASDGMYMQASARATVERSAFADNGRDGILLAGTSRATVTNSEFADNERDGILLTHAAEVVVGGSRITGNASRGISLLESARASVDDTAISGNGVQGVFMGGTVQASITGSTINANTFDGLFLRDSAQLTLERNAITANGSRGVALFEEPCFPDVADVFNGHVTGSGNIIPGPDGEHANATAFCPDVLAFLVSEEGGELDRRR